VTPAAARKYAAQICGFAQADLALADELQARAADLAAAGRLDTARNVVDQAVRADCRAAESHARAAGLRTLADMTPLELAAARARSYRRLCLWAGRCGAGLPSLLGRCPLADAGLLCRHAGRSDDAWDDGR
jgi:hypothetical protein